MLLVSAPSREGFLSRALLPLAVVCCLWLGFAHACPLLPDALPPLALLVPVLLAFMGLRAGHAGRAFRRGWLAAWGGHLAALYWLYLPIYQVGGLPWWLAIPCAAFVAAMACLGLLAARSTAFMPRKVCDTTLPAKITSI